MASFSDPGGDFNPYEPPSATADGAPVWQPDEDEMLLPAERGTRWWARFVDNILLAISFVPSLVITTARRDHDPVEIAGMVVFVVPLALLCYQWWLVATRGQSIAKRWLDIRIVRLDGSPVGFVHGVLLRGWIPFAMQMIPTIGGIIGLVDALMIFGDQRRCLHDHIAGTRVVLALKAV